MLPQTIKPVCQEGRRRLFVDFIKSEGSAEGMLARFESRLYERQRSSLKYGFRGEQWLKTRHGDAKALKIMDRKRQLGLPLVRLTAVVPKRSCQSAWNTRVSRSYHFTLSTDNYSVAFFFRSLGCPSVLRSRGWHCLPGWRKIRSCPTIPTSSCFSC